MRGYAGTRSNPFQYGVPFNKYPRPSEDHGVSGDNFYKMLCSWLNFKYSIGSIPEVDKIRNVFTAMFQADQKQVVKKHRKTKPKTVPHIVKIDLDKIDKNLKLSNKEKRRLKHILSQIKYRELGSHLSEKEIRRRYRKPKRTATTNKHQKSRRASMEKSEERKSWQRCECEDCELCSEEDRSQTKTNRRRSFSTITPSEERIFKTLVNLDRRCCGEPFKRLFNKRSKRSFIEQNQNINIENLELKYIQPTCLLQYSGKNGKVSMIDVLNQPGSGFCLGESFLASALGSKAKQFDRGDGNSYCCSNNSRHRNQRKTPEENIEKKRSNNQQEKQGDASGKFDLEEDLESLKRFFDRSSTKTDSENTEALVASDDRLKSPQTSLGDMDYKQFPLGDSEEHFSEHNKAKKNTSKYQRLKNFAKKCFCLSGNEDDRNAKPSRRERKRRHRNASLRKKFNLPNSHAKNLTDSAFLERKKEINKKTIYI